MLATGQRQMHQGEVREGEEEVKEEGREGEIEEEAEEEEEEEEKGEGWEGQQQRQQKQVPVSGRGDSSATILAALSKLRVRQPDTAAVGAVLAPIESSLDSDSIVTAVTVLASAKGDPNAPSLALSLFEWARQRARKGPIGPFKSHRGLSRKAYNAAAKLLLRQCKVVAAARLLDDGVPPSLETCNEIMEGLLQMGKVREAVGVLNEARNGGLKLSRDSYQLFLQGLGPWRTSAHWPLLYELFSKMKQDGMAPDPVSVCTFGLWCMKRYLSGSKTARHFCTSLHR